MPKRHVIPSSRFQTPSAFVSTGNCDWGIMALMLLAAGVAGLILAVVVLVLYSVMPSPIAWWRMARVKNTK